MSFQGHEGPLCGSCKESYGKSHSFLCEKCFTDVGNVILVCLSFLVLLGLSVITIRSNLISAVSLPEQPQTPMTSAASTSSHSAPSSSRAEIEMRIAQHVSNAAIGSEQDQNTDPAQSHEDAELAKWKAAELFKVQIATSFLRPHYSECSADCSELCAGHSHSCRCRCEMDIRNGGTFPDCR